MNDGFGHKIGDAVLSEVAARLDSLKGFLSNDANAIDNDGHANADENNLLCRWGGDEFLFLSKYKHQTCIENLVNAIQHSIQAPIKIASTNISLGASIGIAKYPSDNVRADELIQYADISMYHHKKYAVGNAVEFSLALLDEFQRDQIIRDGLKQALLAEELSLVFHPIIDTHTNEAWALEALIRWRHKGKVISPDEFIPIAEKSGHIIQIGRWVLFEACQQAMRWQTTPLPAVSVNVSALQLLDKHFVETVSLALQDSGLPAERLHLEITESVMLENANIAVSQLKQISALGIHISIDDFGTGYSSLNQLQSMAFDIIKIDRSFLQDLSKKDITIISATKLIADEFDAVAVAEGIETEKELQVLKQIGIRYIQGYLFAKPMPPEKVDAWLLENQSAGM